jgi:thioredoxin 1
MAQAITKDNLQELLDSGKPVVIDFWAEWCGPCRMIAPIVEEMAEKYKDQAFVGKCDIEENNDIAVKYSVRNIPTVLFIKDGQVVDKQVGACSASALEEKLTKLL